MTTTDIERELRIQATPETVYEVISSPQHMAQWWPVHAELDAAVGSTGSLTFGDPSSPDAKSERLTVVEADPPRRFAFRWVYSTQPGAPEGHSLLVTFDLEASEDGTLLRFRESGFDQREWDAATWQQSRADHVQGWTEILPRLTSYAARSVARS